jgi:hypothetical protein
MDGGGKKLLIMRGKDGGNVVRFDRNDSSTITVCFNPTEYSIEKTNAFAEAAIPGLDSPIIQYTHGNGRTLSLELVVDTLTYDDGADIRDKYIDKFEGLLGVDGSLHAPPPCKLVWGSLEFVGVLASLAKRYVMFKDDGTPVRARLTMKWKEHVPVDLQLRAMPRLSPDKRRVHTIEDGDALWLIATRAYGDPRHWKVLADANQIDDPLRLQTGAELVIPPLPET